MVLSKGIVLGFDYGLKNVGVAVATIGFGSARPLPALKARDGVPNWQEVEQLLNEWQPQLVIVGLPLNMDGSHSDMSQRAEKFGRRINGRFNTPYEMMDERLSSYAAKEEAGMLGHRGDYGKNPIDSIAAQHILDSWLNSR